MMTTSTKQARSFRPTLGRVALALTLASVMGGLSVPAFGDDRDEHRGNGVRNGDRGDRNVDRDRDRGGRGYGRRYPHPYRYAAPVYAPPPVYYPPQPSPGFSLFFPLDIRVR